jgi:hypothetical protein
VSDFDPPTLEQIAVARAGDGSVALYPPGALSDISDFDTPTKEMIAARRAGLGVPITDIYPPGSFSSEKKEEVVESKSPSPPPAASSTRFGARSGRVTKAQAKPKGIMKTTPPIKPKPKKTVREQLASIEWKREKEDEGDDTEENDWSGSDYGWDGDRFADIVGDQD